LSNPNSLYSFDDNDVYIPICVIEELDTFKSSQNELGRNARHVSRLLDGLRDRGSLNHGVKLFPDRDDCDSGFLYITLDSDMGLLPSHFERKPDNLILSVALMLKSKLTNPVVLITKDSNLRIKADALNIKVQDFEADKVSVDELYTGITEFVVSDFAFNEFQTTGQASLEDFETHPNQFVIIRPNSDLDQFAYGRMSASEDHSDLLQSLKFDPAAGFVSGIYPRNLEQTFALDLLLDDSIKLVTLVGSAGCGKTLLAIAAGLSKVTDTQKYQKLLVSRPVLPLGKDIGFLPGDISEKMNPWMMPIFDNLELILGGNKKGRQNKNYEMLIEQGIVAVEPITYIRGRSIPNQYFLIDEAQNLSAHELRTIITRAGDNTKIVLTGDPHQIDNPHVDASSNGLTYVVEKMRKYGIAGHVSLFKGERSELATLAAEVL
jgi:PhoH-like ATPase